MGKYRLLKDLPFAKAGAEVGVELAISVRGKDNFLTWIGDPKDLESLIDEGWIEEVKPREFYIVFDKNSKILGAIDDQRTTFLGAHRFIKVREVLE